jgi:hypothetical protein
MIYESWIHYNRIKLVTMWCSNSWMPLLIPMLVVVSDEKSPRIHEKGSDIASAAMPSWAACQYHIVPYRPERIISKPAICLLIIDCAPEVAKIQRGRYQ